jgi:hypothetical protein
MVTVTMVSAHTRISSWISRFCMGVNPVKPSNTTTLPFKIFDLDRDLRSTSSVSSVVIK